MSERVTKRSMQQARILQQEPVAEGIFSLTLFAPQTAEAAHAGQFVSVYTGDDSRLLPRPISLCGFDALSGTIRLIYRVAGDGTKGFSQMRPGEFLRILGPLGNGYPALFGRVLLLGGGVGIPPLLALAKQTAAENPKGEVSAVLGYRNAQTFLAEEFSSFGRVVTATEDGSAGVRGTVLDAVKTYGLSADVICACGPKGMLSAVKTYAAEKSIPLFLSLEERMACGIGACLGCVVRTTQENPYSHVRYARVCADGPIFSAEEVDLS